MPMNILKDVQAILRTLSVNRDIMIRTLCLIFAFAWFTNEGAKSGDVLLATNAILMQFVTFSAFFLDGYALAAESLVGTAVGSKNRERFDRTLRYISELGLLTAAILSFVFFLSGPIMIDLLTNVDEVRNTTRTYLLWAVAAPVISLWCYLLDGVFIGATNTREMRNAMVLSLLVYLGAWYFLAPVFAEPWVMAVTAALFYRASTNALVLPAQCQGSIYLIAFPFPVTVNFVARTLWIQQ